MKLPIQSKSVVHTSSIMPIHTGVLPGRSCSARNGSEDCYCDGNCCRNETDCWCCATQAGFTDIVLNTGRPPISLN
jgi:hypothetical protein